MSSEYVLEVKRLSKTYGNKRVLNDVSFNVKHNEIVGFIGPNGAGKSTAMKCICNLIFPDSGNIIINGYDLFKEREKALKAQASLIEGPGLYQDMTGRDNMQLIANLRGIKKERVEEICDFTELRETLNRKVSGYSMGMKQIGEVEKLAHRIICINKGEIIEVPEVMSNIQKYIIQISDLDSTVSIVTNIVGEDAVEIITSDSIKFEVQNQDILSEILFQILYKKIKVYDICKDNIDIETIYEGIYCEDYTG